MLLETTSHQNDDHFGSVTPVRPEDVFAAIVPPPRKPNDQEATHPALGKPTTVYKYINLDGQTVGYVCRWDILDLGKPKKEVRPLRYGTLNGNAGYYWKGWKDDTNRPLYGLGSLSRLGPNAPVLLVEGEKTADAAAGYFPKYAVLSPMNGSQSPHLADLSPIAGRDVSIWPDHDQPGADFAEALAKLSSQAGARSVKIVQVPEYFPDKWDLADPIPSIADAELLNDLLAQAGSATEPATGGPDMSILRTNRRSPPKFPGDVFGGLEQTIGTLAESTSTPIDYTGAALLTVAAAVIGNSRLVSPWDGWQEPACLWAGIIGTPSSGKSPSLKPIIDAIKTIEAREAAGFETLRLKWEAEFEFAKRAREAWEKKIAIAYKENTEPPPLPPEAKQPPEPHRPRIMVSDTTPEALAGILAGEARGLLSYRDELSGWLGSFDRYTGAQAERPFWLEAFGGRPYIVDRVKLGAPLVIPRLTISVLGGIQPDKLTSLFLSGDDDGLCARMLMVWPEPIPPKRPTALAKTDQLQACLDRLYSLNMSIGPDGVKEPIILMLDEGAASHFDDWRRSHCKNTSETTGILAGHFGKYPGLLLRVALVLELLWWASSSKASPPGSVSIGAVKQAARLMDQYFRPMAECVYGDASTPEIERLESVLARWILKTNPKTINARELRRKHRLPGLRDAKKVNATLEALVEAKWLEAAPDREGGTPGRQRSDYKVNAQVYRAKKDG